MYTMNFWPILVASVVIFGISTLWYSPILFGKEWMDLVKLSDEEAEVSRSKGLWKLYIVQFIMSLISFCVLAFIITSSNSDGASNGAFVGFLVWLGFVMTSGIGSLIWEKKPFKLVLINSVSILLNLVIGGAIIGAWK